MAKDTSAIKDILYKDIDTKISNSSILKKYQANISKFMEERSEGLFSPIPCDRLYFRDDDRVSFFASLDLDPKFVLDTLDQTYYATISNFNPKAAKDEFTVTQLCVLRHFVLKNDKKNINIAALYLAFSGKFYPSVHYRSFPNNVPVPYVMEYVVNNNLSKKYDLVQYGSVIKTIESICNTWLSTYSSKFKSFDDDDVVYLIQQLHSRIGSFIKNIAEEYYKAYANKDNFMTYDSDSYEQDDYHLADSDSLRMEKTIESSMQRINSTSVNYSVCKMCSDSNIKATEIQSIVESIMNNTDNMNKVRRLVSLIVGNYFASVSSGDKSVTDISFITYSIAPKPNAKQKEIVEQKAIVVDLLSENSTAYLRRRSREATKNSYEKAILSYFVFTIHMANK